MTIAILAMGVKCQLFTSCISIQQIKETGFCRLRHSPWVLREGCYCSSSPDSSDRSISLQPAADFIPLALFGSDIATRALVPHTAPSRNSLHPGNASAHNVYTAENHLKLKLEFCFSKSLVCVLQTKTPKGATQY